MLTKEEILGALTESATPYNCKALGGEVLLRPLSTGEVMAAEEADNALFRFIAHALIDENGVQIMDAEAVPTALGFPVVKELGEEIARRNGLSGEAQDDLVKNSESGPDAASSSG